jgi:hypothetical protein
MPHKDKAKAKMYHQEYFKLWYVDHKDEVIARRKKRQAEMRDWFRRYKSSLKCMDCGISHPLCSNFIIVIAVRRVLILLMLQAGLLVSGKL